MTVASIKWSAAVSPTCGSMLHITAAEAGRTAAFNKNSRLATPVHLN